MELVSASIAYFNKIVEINRLELSEYFSFIQLYPCYFGRGGVMGVSPRAMVGGKNWSAGDGGRQKLVRGRQNQSEGSKSIHIKSVA